MDVNAKNAKYFYSFGVEHIPKEIIKLVGNKNITTNVYRTSAHGSIMCGYFCIGFIDFMLKDKRLFYSIQIYFLLMIIRWLIK